MIMRDGNSVAQELRAKSKVKLLSSKVVSQDSIDSPPPQDAIPILEQVNQARHHAEKTAILNALTSTRWNRKQAAVLLNIDYKALLYKMRKLGIDDQPSAVPVKSESSNSALAQGAAASGD
jgi:DNA-binding NtrC family response regulator